MHLLERWRAPGHRDGQLALRSRSGWLRIWVIAAGCWVLFAVYQVVMSPSLPVEEVLSRPAFGEQSIENAKARAIADARSLCIDYTISPRIIPDRIPKTPNWVNSKRLRDAAYIVERDFEYIKYIFGPEQFVKELKSGGLGSDYTIGRIFGINSDRVSSNRAPLTRDALRALWIAVNIDNIYKRDERLAQRAFHTHVLSISCVSETTLRDRSAWAAGLILGPPLAALIGVALAAVILLRVGRWALSGFRSPVAAASGDRHHELPASPEPVSRTGWLKPPKIPRALQWALVPVILVLGGALSHALSGVTKSTLADVRSERNSATYLALERQIREKLPLAAGDNVFAIDIDATDQGLSWTYQRRGPGSRPDAAFLNDIESGACRNTAVRDIIANGFSVEYVLIDQSGSPLGKRNVISC